MPPKEKIFDDIARFAGETVSLVSGVTRQVREEIRARVDELATRMDLVPREDFERLELGLSEMRKALARMAKKIEALENKKSPGSASQVKKPSAKQTRKAKSRS